MSDNDMWRIEEKYRELEGLIAFLLDRVAALEKENEALVYAVSKLSQRTMGMMVLGGTRIP